MRPTLLIISAGALGASACYGVTERFTPTERAGSISPTGYIAADYDVIMGGEVVGDAEVWSTGAFEDDGPDPERTLLHVGLRVENNSDVPLRLDQDRLQVVAGPGPGLDQAITAAEVEGSLVIEPGDEQVVNMFFEMPPGVSPQQLDDFQLSWTLTSSEGEYTQRTPFTEYEPQPAYNYYGYYGSFYDPYWGFWGAPGPYVQMGSWYRPYYTWGNYPRSYYSGPQRPRRLPAHRHVH